MLVEINNLHIGFESRTGFAPAVKGVSMTLGTEKLGIVGESGSGKSLTARALMKLLPKQTRIEADKLSFDGIDILSATEKQMRQIRGKRAGFILQDPKYSLNPVKTIGSQVAESWRTHKGGSRREALEAAVTLLEQVKIRDPARSQHPIRTRSRAAWASAS
jgi:peptide/nickel transport system ATP-binding protein